MKSIFLSYLLFSFIVTNAQISFQAGIHPLEIGQKCPDFKFSNIINYSSDTARLSDFKGKWVIIDFWATWCASCLNSMPKMDSLQKKFSGEIIIMPVTYQPTEPVRNFIARNRVLKSLALPTVTADTLLHAYFRHNLLPHIVWIGPDGTVKAITSSDEVNDRNIRSYLEGHSVVHTVKKDIESGYAFLTKPLLLGGLGENYRLDQQSLLYSSVITGYIPGLVSAGPGPALLNGYELKFIVTNVDIARLYQLPFAFRSRLGRDQNPDFYLEFPSRVIWEAKDSTLFNWPGRDKGDWRQIPPDKRLFCYELIVPSSDSLDINTKVLADLNHFFSTKIGIAGSLEKRKVKCFVLQQVDRSKIPYSKQGNHLLKFDVDKDSVVAKNCTINTFLFYWLKFHLPRFPFPVIDESGISGTLDMEFHAVPKDFNAVNEALKKYGLQFVYSERELPMIVIKDVR